MPLPDNTPNQGGIPNDSRDVSPIRSLNDIALVGSDILNASGTAEGSFAPPLQHGGFRIPSPTGFHVISQTFNPTTINSTFKLAWTDVTDSADGLGLSQIAGYRIYANLAIDNNPNPTLVGQSPNSPCYATIANSTASSKVTFFLQPYLTSGGSLPLMACPSCTGTTPTPFFSFTSGNITVIIDPNRQIGGGTAPGIGVINNSTGRQTSIAAGFIVAFKDLAGTQRMWSIGFDSSGHGQLFMYDGTNSGGLNGVGDRIQLDGGQGHAIFLSPGGSNPAVLDLKSDNNFPELIIENVTAVTATGGTVLPPTLAVGYLDWLIGGTHFKIPYYNN